MGAEEGMRPALTSSHLIQKEREKVTENLI
jgi:hypothetical protein